MKIIITFAGLGEELSFLTNNRPYPLLRLAGSTILGHVLAMAKAVLPEEVTLILDGDTEQVLQWTNEFLSGVTCRVVDVGPAEGSISALKKANTSIDQEETLLIFANHIVEADYRILVKADADVACLVSRQDLNEGDIDTDAAGYVTNGIQELASAWPGVCWFRHGTDLVNALEAPVLPGEDDSTALIPRLFNQKLKIITQDAYVSLDSRTTEDLIDANEGLLQFGHGSEDAIERSYAEDFTVLPPVFIHDTAFIENSVIGPFVNIEAGAIIRQSIVRNSLLGVGVQVENAILDGSIIGDRAQVKGHPQGLYLADDARVIDEKHNSGE